MKKFTNFFITLYTGAQFGLMGYILSGLDFKICAIGCLIGVAYWLTYLKQVDLENQIFELKKIIQKQNKIL